MNIQLDDSEAYIIDDMLQIALIHYAEHNQIDYVSSKTYVAMTDISNKVQAQIGLQQEILDNE